MKFLTAAVAALAAAGTLGTAIAVADDTDSAPSIHQLGTQGTVADGPGLQGWTISDLRPSPDPIAYQPRGALWEATATDEALQGSAIPIIANFSARTPGGQQYPALFSVATPQGVSPGMLGQGQKTSGKVYFDVTGDAPNAVVYSTGGADRLKWDAPAPRQQAGSAPQAPQPPRPVPAPRPAPAPAPAPAQSGSAGAPSGSGSAGTPLPESAGTPLPAEAPVAAAAAGGSGASSGSAGTSAGN